MPTSRDGTERPPAGRQTAGAVFAAFLQLGLTAFGGPVAHLGYFREAFVVRRRWLDDRAYADLVALCQFLAGPASSQVGMAIGLTKAGPLGMLAAWVAFTAPSALALIVFGYGVTTYREAIPDGVLHGLKVVAVAVVAQAVWGMARSLCPDRQRMTMALLAAVAALVAPGPLTQIAIIAAGALAGLAALKADDARGHARPAVAVGRGWALAALALFAVLLAGLPLAAAAGSTHALDLIDSFFRTGALVFGGGHVVLPLLQAEVVPPGWVGPDAFLAGYGAAQAVPGPLFTFAAYLGTVGEIAPNGWQGGLICLLAVFAPSFLLVAGTMPFWEALRHRTGVRRALMGVNAAVVGLLLAALYDPVWTSAIAGPADLALALIAMAALALCRVPPWAVVLATAAAGWALA